MTHPSSCPHGQCLSPFTVNRFVWSGEDHQTFDCACFCCVPVESFSLSLKLFVLIPASGSHGWKESHTPRSLSPPFADAIFAPFFPRFDPISANHCNNSPSYPLRQELGGRYPRSRQARHRSNYSLGDEHEPRRGWWRRRCWHRRRQQQHNEYAAAMTFRPLRELIRYAAFLRVIFSSTGASSEPATRGWLLCSSFCILGVSVLTFLLCWATHRHSDAAAVIFVYEGLIYPSATTKTASAFFLALLAFQACVVLYIVVRFPSRVQFCSADVPFISS